MSPKVARLLVWISLPRAVRNTVVADLDEEYHFDIVRTRTRRQAKIWYWCEAFSLMKWYLFARMHGNSVGATSVPLTDRRKSKHASPTRAYGLLESVAQDGWFGIRSLRRRPSFTVVAVITLGLGIGATTTMFSVVDGVLLRQLPFGTPGELVNVWKTNSNWRDDPFFSDYWDKGPLDWSDFERWRDANTQFRSVAAHGGLTMILTGLGDPEQISVGLASAGLFQALGVNLTIGRSFLPGEDGATAQRIAVLSNSLWRTRFAADPEVLGKTLTLDGESYSIVGVLPPGFRLRMLVLGNPESAGDRAVWIPIGQPGILGGLEHQPLEGLGLLAPGISADQAQAETASIFAGEESPSTLGARLVPRKVDETGKYRTPLLLLFGAAGVLLLAACSNVAMLAVGEAAGRRTELATRAALGAGTSRILRQVLTECIILGVLGSAVGVAITFAGTAVLESLGPPIPRLDGVDVSIRVLSFACSAGVVTGVLFGLAPTALFTRDSAAIGLRESSHRTSRGGKQLQSSVVMLEIALTTVLLVSGGLFARSLANLLAVDPGIRPSNLATLHVPLPESRYPTGADAGAFFKSVQQRLEAIPGVINASGTAALPFGPYFIVETPVMWFQIVGRESVEGEPPPQGWRSTGLPRYHETLGVPVLAGRGINEADDENAPRVALINEAMARRYWSNESPVGATIMLGGDECTVVGIVGNVRHGGLDLDVEPMIHVPQSQHPTHALSFVVRTSGDPLRLLPQLRQAVWSVDADVPVTRVSTMDALIAQSGSDLRFRTILMMVFAVTAVIVATGGVFSVTAQAVARQTREFGIRMALGARSRNLLRIVLRRSLGTAVVGTIAGLTAALWATRVLASFLFGVEPSDPLTYGVVSALLIAVCAGASVLPARRASRVDPVEALKAD